MNNKVCYYCGSEAISKEHVPPKQLFKGFICDKITVPSCDKHNGNKSMEDEAIIKSMLLSLYNLSDRNEYEDTIVKAINIAKIYFPQVKKYVKSGRIANDLPMELDCELAHISGEVNVPDWMRQSAAALIYSVINQYDSNNEFENAIVYSPNWLPSKASGLLVNVYKNLAERRDIEVNYEHLKWYEGWKSGNSPYPKDIFEFYFNITGKEIFLKLIFYKRFTWYVSFKASNKTRKIISKNRIKNYSTKHLRQCEE